MSISKIKLVQITSCIGLSFAHGAQDGLKFFGLLKLFFWMNDGHYFFLNEFMLLFLCALMMGIGTIIGGKKIVFMVGKQLAKLDFSSALISEMSTISILLLGNLFGLPLSTSHVKTISCACIGKNLDKGMLAKIVLTWLMLLPVCFMIAFFLAKII